jgi:uncharacterized protein YutE (UPF0331/DUF86 family)
MTFEKKQAYLLNMLKEAESLEAYELMLFDDIASRIASEKIITTQYFPTLIKILEQKGFINESMPEKSIFITGKGLDWLDERINKKKEKRLDNLNKLLFLLVGFAISIATTLINKSLSPPQSERIEFPKTVKVDTLILRK